EASPDPQGRPRYLVKSLLPLGFVLLFLQGVGECVRILSRGRETGETPTVPNEPEDPALS
ncbi:MAG: C4-dicarboxylate ABC transporter substrate-binding protein, partial [Verrucomicrobiota bacterium]